MVELRKDSGRVLDSPEVALRASASAQAVAAGKSAAALRVVLVTETYPPKMGYLVTSLPKYLARLGMEVHVVAMDLPPYYNAAPAEVAGAARFLHDQALAADTSSSVDGYTVHILRHRRILGYAVMPGLLRKLRQLRPDVVYSVVTLGWNPLLAAAAAGPLGYKLFIGSHTPFSGFSLARDPRPRVAALLRNFVMRWLPGRFVSLVSHKCYCPTSDCAEVAARFFGVQAGKLAVVHLGIDTDFFFPASSADEAARAALRRRLGFADEDIVCIYTGKMGEMKNPVLLARAIEQLRAEGRPFRGLFIGDGTQRPAVERYPGSVVMDFMEFSRLGDFYRACDIGVWLTNESTSMLDAAGCGLPLIVSDRIYQDHVTGNGLAYRMNDLDSLLQTLRRLQDAEVRRALGAAGAQKMRQSFSWAGAAQRRLVDFQAAVGG